MNIKTKSKLFSENRKLAMEKLLLKNKLERMEKLLDNQQSQQQKLSDNYFSLLKVIMQMQKGSQHGKYNYNNN